MNIDELMNLKMQETDYDIPNCYALIADTIYSDGASESFFLLYQSLESALVNANENMKNYNLDSIEHDVDTITFNCSSKRSTYKKLFTIKKYYIYH